MVTEGVVMNGGRVLLATWLALLPACVVRVISESAPPPDRGLTPPPPRVPVIEVVSGSYGPNCGAPPSNKTAHLASTCNGRSECDYRVDYHVIGDPAEGCEKTYVAEWRCSGAPMVYKAVADGEAGFGRIVSLGCANPAPSSGSRPRGGLITVVAATYGENCGAPSGNVTARLASACDGRPRCAYAVDYRIIGDPAVGCGKTYVAEWRCGASPEVHRVDAPPEAGFGSVVTLACDRL